MKRAGTLLLLLASTVFAPLAMADKAYLAGGCFWCMEKDFEALDGVSGVVSGFTGGTAENPTYRGDHTGHYEVVEKFPDQTIVTPILPAAAFYPIKGDEIGHQDFYKKNPVRYKTYRWGCGRDKRLKAIWGDEATV